MVRCIRISVSDRWFVLMPHLQSHRIIQILGNHKTPIPLTCKALCFSDFCTDPVWQLVPTGSSHSKRLSPFLHRVLADHGATRGGDRSRGARELVWTQSIHRGQLKKKRYVQSKTKKPTSQRLFWFLFMGTKSLFLGGEEGIYQSERFSSCDRFPRRWKRL